jgi:hypothetical protein
MNLKSIRLKHVASYQWASRNNDNLIFHLTTQIDACHVHNHMFQMTTTIVLDV